LGSKGKSPSQSRKQRMVVLLRKKGRIQSPPKIKRGGAGSQKLAEQKEKKEERWRAKDLILVGVFISKGGGGSHGKGSAQAGRRAAQTRSYRRNLKNLYERQGQPLLFAEFP